MGPAEFIQKFLGLILSLWVGFLILHVLWVKTGSPQDKKERKKKAQEQARREMEEARRASMGNLARYLQQTQNEIYLMEQHRLEMMQLAQRERQEYMTAIWDFQPRKTKNPKLSPYDGNRDVYRYGL